MFFNGRKASAEKAARYLMAYVQVLFVQRVIDLAKKQDKNLEETAGAALLHGIAYLFLKAEKLEVQGKVDNETLLKTKEEIINANLKFGFKKDEITSDKLEMLAKGVYEILGQLRCDGNTVEEVVIKKTIDSFCEISGMVANETVLTAVYDLDKKVNQYFSKYTII